MIKEYIAAISSEDIKSYQATNIGKFKDVEYLGYVFRVDIDCEHIAVTKSGQVYELTGQPYATMDGQWGVMGQGGGEWLADLNLPLSFEWSKSLRAAK